MSTEQELRTYFQEQFALLSNANNNQVPEIQALRQKALDSFVEQGFPITKHEEYKYTPITKILLKSFQTAPKENVEPQVIPPFNEYLIPELQGHILVFWNGRLVYRSSDSEEGLYIEDINAPDASQAAYLHKHLAKVADHKSDAFTALNTAFFNHGAYIRIAAGKVIEQPIIVYHLWDQNANYVQTRHLVVAESNSQSQLIEIYKNVDGSRRTFHNAVTEMVVEEAAHIGYNKIQTECAESIHVGTTHIIQERDSVAKCSTITTEGMMIRNNLKITVNGKHCESHMYGLYLLQNGTHVDNHTVVDHCMPDCFSNELYKGIIDDKATGVFNGKIFVRANAQKTNAFQSNKNLLLSDKASMNTKPQLEIWADDVKCSHGATTGQLDKEQMFYLRSRGLDQKQARGLLLYAFAKEALDQISSEVLKSYLDAIIVKRLYQPDND